MKILINFDGVLNNLNERVFESLGLAHKYAKLKHYDIQENDNLTQSEKDAIQNLYRHDDIYMELGIKPTVDSQKLYQLQENHEVFIYTLKYNARQVESVYRFISRYYSGLKAENIMCMVGKSKPALQGFDIVIEDCAENLSKYSFSELAILIDKPYNRKNCCLLRAYSISKVIDSLNER